MKLGHLRSASACISLFHYHFNERQFTTITNCNFSKRFLLQKKVFQYFHRSFDSFLSHVGKLKKVKLNEKVKLNFVGRLNVQSID
jgi:hypothetical protein